MIAGLVACLALGDSIALGTGRAMGCSTVARVGASSTAIVRMAHDLPRARVTVLSAGSNDPASPMLRANLETMRARASGVVVWIVPRDARAASVVLSAARAHGDRHVDLSTLASGDGVHPRSYATVARRVREEAGRGARAGGERGFEGANPKHGSP